MASVLNVTIHAIAVGLLAIVFGYISGAIVRPFTKVTLPEVCKDWNKHYVMEWSLFIVGVLIFFTAMWCKKIKID